MVSCVGMIEHMPMKARERAIEEMVRVSSHALLVAFPHGNRARACDEKFKRECEKHGRPFSAWAAEHLEQQYPTVGFVSERVETVAKASGAGSAFSGPTASQYGVSRFVRKAGVKSDTVFVAVSLLFGLLFRMLPTPGVDNSYRAVVLARFDDGRASAQLPARVPAA